MLLNYNVKRGKKSEDAVEKYLNANAVFQSLAEIIWLLKAICL